MALVNLIINNSCTEQEEISFQTLNTKLNNIMISLEQLSEEVGGLRQQVTGLQTAIDTEQEQVTNAINGLNTTIQQLQEQLANGATPEQLQTIFDQVVEVRNTLQTAQTDLSGTIADQQPEPGNGDANTPPPTPDPNF